MTAWARRARLAVVVGCAVALLLLVAGWRPVVLLSDSMAPSMRAGALVVTRPVAVADVAVGDVVTVPRPGGAPVTHRVVDVDVRADGTASLRLRGDANPAPDRTRATVDGQVLRAVLTVPVVGRLLTLPGWAWLGIAVAGLGLVALRRTIALPPEPLAPATPSVRTDDLAVRTDDPSVPAADPRAVALDATLEDLAERLPAATVTALARVRAGALGGLADVEAADGVARLDDGARFVLIALADADEAALAAVPAGSRRTIDAIALVDRWWAAHGDALPPPVAHELRRWLADVGQPT